MGFANFSGIKHTKIKELDDKKISKKLPRRIHYI